MSRYVVGQGTGAAIALVGLYLLTGIAVTLIITGLALAGLMTWREWVDARMAERAEETDGSGLADS